MEIRIKGHHIAVTPAISSFVEKRIARLQKRLENATHIIVDIKGKAKNGIAPSIHIMVHFAGRQTIVVKEFLKLEVKDFYSIITKAFDTLNVSLGHHASIAGKQRYTARICAPRNLSLA